MLCAPMALALRRLWAPSIRTWLTETAGLFAPNHDAQGCPAELAIVSSQRPQVSCTSLVSRLYSPPHVTWLHPPRPVAVVEAQKRDYAKSKNKGKQHCVTWLVCCIRTAIPPRHSPVQVKRRQLHQTMLRPSMNFKSLNTMRKPLTPPCVNPL